MATTLNLDKAVQAAVEELERQHHADCANTPYVDADDVEYTLVDGRVDLRKVIKAALDAA